MNAPVAPPRRPKGYVGLGHETIGSDILAVLNTLKFPEQVLGAETANKLRAVDATAWYPIGWLLELMETLDQRVGYFGLVSMGKTLFKETHEEQAKKVAHSARDIIYALDAMYHNANRGQDIGGWRVVRFDDGMCELDKNTPHHCVMEQGILQAALEAVGVSSMVSQKQCFRQGADSCIYVLTSAVRGAKWSGAPGKTA